MFYFTSMILTIIFSILFEGSVSISPTPSPFSYFYISDDSQIYPYHHTFSQALQRHCLRLQECLVFTSQSQSGRAKAKQTLKGLLGHGVNKQTEQTNSLSPPLFKRRKGMREGRKQASSLQLLSVNPIIILLISQTRICSQL